MNEWLGRAGGVSQVRTLTVSGVGSGAGTLNVTVGPKTISVPVANTQTAAAFAAALYAALAASVEPEVTEVSFAYTAAGVVVTCTVRTPGLKVPIMAGGPVTNNGITLTPATVTAATGPNDAANVVNWSANALPSSGLLTLIRSGPDITDGLDTAFVNADTIEVRSEWAGRRLGLPRQNAGGYSEYRQRRPIFKAGATLTVGTGNNGPGPLYVGADFAGGGYHVVVLATSGPDTGEAGAVDISSANNAADIRVMGGSCQFNADSTAGTAGNVHVTGGKFVLLNNAAASTFVQDGGVSIVSGNFAACPVTLNGGELFIIGGSQSNWTLNGGTLYVSFSQGAGSPVTVAARGYGPGRAVPVVDARSCPGSITLIADSSFTGGAKLLDPFRFVLGAAAIKFDPASITASDLGIDIPVTRV
jgi:hypothetical protein